MFTAYVAKNLTPAFIILHTDLLGIIIGYMQPKTLAVTFNKGSEGFTNILMCFRG